MAEHGGEQEVISPNEYKASKWEQVQKLFCSFFYPGRPNLPGIGRQAQVHFKYANEQNNSKKSRTNLGTRLSSACPVFEDNMSQ